MKHFYALFQKTLVATFLLVGWGSQSMQAQTSVCGPIAENFNNTNGGTAGFNSSTLNSTAPGFTFGQSGQNGFLQRCGVPTGGTVFEMTTPTYQTLASQTSVGYGFELSGIVLVSRVIVFLQYIDNVGNINTVEVANFVPTYNGPGGSGVAAECRAFSIGTYTGFTPGEAYRLIFQFTASSASNNNQCIVFDNFRTTGTNSAITLPVSFTNLTIRRNGNQAELVWNVAGEKDVNYYEVERSADGRNFVKIGEIPARASSAYAYADAQPLTGVSFYRVRNMDLDSRSKYSYVVRYNANRISAAMQVYPNPVKSEAVIEHQEYASNARFSIIDMNGRIVKTIVPLRGVNNTRINLADLSTGVYVLRIENGNGYSESTSFVKQ